VPRALVGAVTKLVDASTGLIGMATRLVGAVTKLVSASTGFVGAPMSDIAAHSSFVDAGLSEIGTLSGFVAAGLPLVARGDAQEAAHVSAGAPSFWYADEPTRRRAQRMRDDEHPKLVHCRTVRLLEETLKRPAPRRPHPTR
jgi:hypothetical protein